MKALASTQHSSKTKRLSCGDKASSRGPHLPPSCCRQPQPPGCDPCDHTGRALALHITGLLGAGPQDTQGQARQATGRRGGLLRRVQERPSELRKERPAGQLPQRLPPDGTLLMGRRLVAQTSGKGLQDETAWVPDPVLPQMGRVNLGKLTSLHLSTRSLRTPVVTVRPTSSDGIERLSTPSECSGGEGLAESPGCQCGPGPLQVPSRGHTLTHSERPMPQQDCLGSGWAQQMAGPRTARPALCPGIATQGSASTGGEDGSEGQRDGAAKAAGMWLRLRLCMESWGCALGTRPVPRPSPLLIQHRRSRRAGPELSAPCAPFL